MPFPPKKTAVVAPPVAKAMPKKKGKPAAKTPAKPSAFSKLSDQMLEKPGC